MHTLLPEVPFPELIIGFVAPIGADADKVIEAFHSNFSSQGYRIIHIKVTEAFSGLEAYVKPKIPLRPSPPEKKYSSYIKYGDQVRGAFSEDSFLAAVTIGTVVRERQKIPERAQFERTVYLLHQFKRPEEIALLRTVYGNIFFQVSVYSRRGARVDSLARKFASGHDSSDINQFRAQAEKLVQTDEAENEDQHGQQVGKIFHSADFIVNLDESVPTPDAQVTRFCELLFSSNKISPTKMEHGMFLARGAALRSVDLSRQVGACISDAQGQIVSLGANEVPKATGGTYWTGGPFDDRDFRRGYDPNQQRKREILSEIAKQLGNFEPVETLLSNPKIKDSQLMDALEYSRVIHAEMNAICDAGRSGRECQDAILYVTTFPCHICAKHIVAVGLSKVVFLEPYPKSLAVQLHNDSVHIEGGDRGPYKNFPAVEFSHFSGVTPRRYQELFAREQRKDAGGMFQVYENGKPHPLMNVTTPFYALSEAEVLRYLKESYSEKLTRRRRTTPRDRKRKSRRSLHLSEAD